MDAGRGRRRGGRRRGGRARPDAEAARDPAQLPGHRAPAVRCSSGSAPSCASTSSPSNDEERPVQPRPARAGSTPRRSSENNYFGFGTDNDIEHAEGYPIIKHRTFAGPGALTGTARAARSVAAAVGQGARRGRAAGPRRSARRRWSTSPGMSFGALSGNAIEALNQGARAGRLPAEHRRGRRSRRTTATAATSSSRSVRRTSAAATSTAASTWPGSRTWSRRRRSGRSRSSCPRAPSPGSAGCCRRPRSARRSPRSAASRRARTAPRPAGTQVFNDVDSMLDFVELVADRDRPAGRHQVRGRQPGVLGRRWSRHGWLRRRRPRRRLRQRRRRRGRHRCGPADLRRLGRLARSGSGFARGLRPLRRGRAHRRRDLHRRRQARPARERRRRLRARRRHGQRRPARR